MKLIREIDAQLVSFAYKFDHIFLTVSLLETDKHGERKTYPIIHDLELDDNATYHLEKLKEWIEKNLK